MNTILNERELFHKAMGDSWVNYRKGSCVGWFRV